MVEWEMRARSVINGSNGAGSNPGIGACGRTADLGWITKIIPTIAVIQLMGSLPKGTYILVGLSLPYVRARNLFSLLGAIIIVLSIYSSITHNLTESVGSHAFCA